MANEPELAVQKLSTLRRAVAAWFDYLDSDTLGTAEEENQLLDAMRKALADGGD